MKKATEWVRKNLKREQKKKDRGIVDFMMITRHFFKDLNQWIGEMEDPSYTVYTQQDFVYMGILKNVCAQLSMKNDKPSDKGGIFQQGKTFGKILACDS